MEILTSIGIGLAVMFTLLAVCMGVAFIWQNMGDDMVTILMMIFATFLTLVLAFSIGTLLLQIME
jgi:FtsH-binding integral membrane protein